MSTVLVTGGSGFVGSHVILKLLAAGHDVRTTVRDLRREADIRTMLKAAGVEPGGSLRAFPADLEQDAGWAEAVDTCDYVMHVASPFPAGNPRDENELIRPAREGTLRVLKAARDAGVQRVVMTSSFAAISYGNMAENGVFTENDWTNTDAPDVQPYPKSKTLAERAAWDFIAREGGALELSVINPTGIFGPVLGPDFSTSTQLIRMMLNGAMPAAPRIHFGVVDVRDVADLHLTAMADPAAKGERFIAVAGQPMSIFEIAMLLKTRMGETARKVPQRQAPDWLVRIFALFNDGAKAAVPQLGVIRAASSQKARDLLGWAPRTNEEAILATAESLVRLKLLKEN